MGKQPAFQFYPGDWMQDTRILSLAARGAWIDLLCAMWRAQNRGELSLTWLGYSRLIAATVEQTKVVIAELVDSGICDAVACDKTVTCHADVTNCPGDVTLRNRRMWKEEKIRTDARLRKQRQRDKRECHARVTLHSSSSSSSSSISKDISEEFDLLRKSAQSDENHHSGPAVSKCPKVEKGEGPGAFHERYMAWATEQVNAFVGNGNAEQLAIAYPGVNLGQEAARALVWLQANPGKRKKDIARFMNNWLARGQERQPAAQAGAGIGQTGPRKTLDQMIAESRERDRINADIRKN